MSWNNILSHAKINLSLKITWIRSDWYHLIDSIFQKISLADVITFEDKNDWIEIRSEGEFRKIPTNSHNSCFKAVSILMQFAKIKKWIKITIEKNIPQMAWLWWGSSNAAFVLKFLNNHWNINLCNQKIAELWAMIWADVPFFIYDSVCAKVSWIWEIVNSCDSIYSWNYIALIKPKYIDVNTKWAYWEFDKFLNTNKSIKLTDNLQNELSNFKNDFEQVIFEYFPDLEILKNHFLSTWALQSNMTWSWSVVFWIFNKKSQAEKAFLSISDKWWWWVFEIL
jgi:4-diphosphocytidyl-2-C-methyl-D-erythritol kinase